MVPGVTWRRRATLSLQAACFAVVGCNDCGGAPAPSTASSAASPPPASAPAASPPGVTVAAGEVPAAPAASGLQMVQDRIEIEGHSFPLRAGGGSGDALGALREYAATAIACPREQVEVREMWFGQGNLSWGPILADGCGHRLVFGAGPVNTGSPVPRFWIVSRFDPPR